MKTYSTHTRRAPRRSRAGFTLIEVMLVVVIIGIMAAVIVPRAWRANIDTKYATLRQTCAQLAGYANDWAERQLETQGGAGLVFYMDTIGPIARTWIADGSTNWTGTPTAPATGVVSDLAPHGTPLRNPFNGLEVFRPGNIPGTSPVRPVPGAIASGQADDDGYNYYALIFQGTDSTTVALNQDTSFHAGQGPSLAGLRNGIFIARVLP